MENVISAQEIKRRGISAVDQALKNGPVHVIQRNRPRYVILSEESYQRLSEGTQARQRLWDRLLGDDEAYGAARNRAELDRELQSEREGWRD
ncbi:MULTISPECIES: type II toxin-antitoxin system Phd/YefM family antitoxin [Halorhodospira]|uniref:type II toxin-antitoxin system Phd/YefM family antitoxin n=1 Tax=Halorhodospira TaxID=85108 RepID=UPI001913382A|nr:MULTISPECIES: type II toxin-antitoxin system Phd/YefM family antitoxin [Halorhodospira]MBK5935888.1 prevent-host-death protein [Halorhodospira halophila]MBK5943055.1 prevent-host-death protein [Halorhodospira halophila]MCG5528490.1 type II toxin-antitoxin system Phd/YefM family antitoxin [Halorhodospira halophila]MCG5534340.1 type II toxin-antitoxin system Phd/YefM family antitoxin [Halorhodospira sp. 9621]MCG5539231.1 type II toxin-antitoxin system Phd/YefM family antitoxin [Halorhodospira